MSVSILKIKHKWLIPVLSLCLLSLPEVLCQHKTAAQSFDNPVSLEWLEENLKKESPRLILTQELEEKLVQKIQNDPSVRKSYQLIRQEALLISCLEPLSYRMTGRRMLGVSREAIRRLVTLALVYRIEKDQRYLDKLSEELEAVCSFSD